MADVTLAGVALRRARAAQAQAELRRAIVSAHQSGYSLRELADAAGVSHMTVKRIIAAEQERESS